MDYRIIEGDCIEGMRRLEGQSVNCVVTSPPYFGLRDYGHDGQIGLEASPDAFVAKLVEVFREVRRVLRDDGTVWLNLGDSYANNGTGGNGATGGRDKSTPQSAMPPIGTTPVKKSVPDGLKVKDLIGIPWRVAFALQADGWYLRQDIIWHKPNPMPESVRDRCTKAHEYIFLLSKAERYYFDSEAMQEPATPQGIARRDRADLRQKEGWSEAYHGNPPKGLAKGRGGKNAFRGQGHQRDSASGPANREGRDMTNIGEGETRNRRSVWTVATKPYKGAHFATFPPDLIRPCILAGCPKDGTVLDPFGGSGTTAQVALEEGRKAVLCELNTDYIALAHKRLEGLQLRIA
jgi:DNA modification methylase